MPVAPLPPEQLYRRCDPEQLGFTTTAEFDGQGRVPILVVHAPTDLGALVKAHAIDLLVLDGASPLLAKPLIWTSLEALGCTMLIGRG